MLEVGTFMLEGHLHSPQETSAQPIYSVRWHFDLVVYGESQFLLGAGLVAIDIVFEVSSNQNTSNLRSEL